MEESKNGAVWHFTLLLTVEPSRSLAIKPRSDHLVNYPPWNLTALCCQSAVWGTNPGPLHDPRTWKHRNALLFGLQEEDRSQLHLSTTFVPPLFPGGHSIVRVLLAFPPCFPSTVPLFVCTDAAAILTNHGWIFLPIPCLRVPGFLGQC